MQSWDFVQPETVFYDGHCGLCHAAVRWAASADREGRAFRYAPLGGETFRAKVPEQLRGTLPDSIVVLTGEGRLLIRSDAIVHMMKRLGGGWRAGGFVVALAPRFLRDLVYDGVARIRSRLFGTPPDVCPMVPERLRGRFER